MATLGAISCLSNVGNTGVPQCFCDPKFITGAMLVPKGSTFTTTSLGAFQTALSTSLYVTSKTGRTFPIYNFETPKFATEQKVVQQMSTGQKHVVREGFNDWSFQYTNGGLSLLKNLRLFNGPNWDFLFIDNDPLGAKIFGITGAAANTLRAIPSDGGFFWANPWTPNDGSKVTEYDLQFAFNTKYANDIVNFVQMPSTFDFPTSMPALNDVVVTASATVNGTPKSFNICLISPLGTDIASLYPAAFAVGSMWAQCTVVATGLPLTVSTATFVSAAGGAPAYFTILMAATNYPTPPAPVFVNISIPTTLVAAGVYFESTGALSIASV
jgi:hypothetical protein